MATGYHLSLGYCSGFSKSQCQAKAWDTFTQWVATMRENTRAIAEETSRLEPSLNAHDVWSVAKTFAASAEGCTLTVIDKVDEHGDPSRSVMLMASGGGEYRVIKEATRRAFCRLALEAMHREGIELNISVS